MQLRDFVFEHSETKNCD